MEWVKRKIRRVLDLLGKVRFLTMYDWIFAKEQMVSYDQKIQEYQDMRELLELKSEYADYDTVGATVIFSDMTGNWFSTFTIDKGTDDGLEVGMNVLSGGGLVGYISDIAKGHAVVTSIINDNVNVSAMQSTTGDACVVTGDLPYMKEHGLLKLQYMDTDFNISRDNVIVTSNISDRYLPGLVIGYAQDVTVDENGLAASRHNFDKKSCYNIIKDKR